MWSIARVQLIYVGSSNDDVTITNTWKRCLFMNRNNYFLIKCWTIIKNILRTLQSQVGVNFKNIEPPLRFTGSYKKKRVLQFWYYVQLSWRDWSNLLGTQAGFLLFIGSRKRRAQLFVFYSMWKYTIVPSGGSGTKSVEHMRFCKNFGIFP